MCHNTYTINENIADYDRVNRLVSMFHVHAYNGSNLSSPIGITEDYQFTAMDGKVYAYSPRFHSFTIYDHGKFNQLLRDGRFPGFKLTKSTSVSYPYPCQNCGEPGTDHNDNQCQQYIPIMAPTKNNNQY